MARRKKWFVTELSNSISRTSARNMFKEMGLSEPETQLLIKRFWDNVPMKSIPEYTISEQTKVLPVLDTWLRNWRANNCSN